jgi:hypothetical protein
MITSPASSCPAVVGAIVLAVLPCPALAQNTYVPPGTLRGVIFNDFVLDQPYAQPRGLVLAGNINAATTNDGENLNLPGMLANIAGSTGRPEIGFLHAIPNGLSAQGRPPAWVAFNHPGRTLAFIRFHSHMRGHTMRVNAAMAGVPGLFDGGGGDMTAGTEDLKAMFLEGRGLDAPWCFVIDPTAGHARLSQAEEAFARAWLDAIIELRDGGSAPGAVVPLRPVSMRAGWLGGGTFVRNGRGDNTVYGRVSVAAYDSFSGERASASWFPNEALARQWQVLVETGAGPQPPGGVDAGGQGGAGGGAGAGGRGGTGGQGGGGMGTGGRSGTGGPGGGPGTGGSDGGWPDAGGADVVRGDANSDGANTGGQGSTGGAGGSRASGSGGSASGAGGAGGRGATPGAGGIGGGVGVGAAGVGGFAGTSSGPQPESPAVPRPDASDAAPSALVGSAGGTGGSAGALSSRAGSGCAVAPGARTPAAWWMFAVALPLMVVALRRSGRNRHRGRGREGSGLANGVAFCLRARRLNARRARPIRVPRRRGRGRNLRAARCGPS